MEMIMYAFCDSIDGVLEKKLDKIDGHLEFVEYLHLILLRNLRLWMKYGLGQLMIMEGKLIMIKIGCGSIVIVV